MTIYYKLQSIDDPELFVKGTPTYNSYDKVGRMFSSIGKLRSFITTAMKCKKEVSSWQVVELEIIVTATKPIHEIVKADKIVHLLKS